MFVSFGIASFHLVEKQELQSDSKKEAEHVKME